MTMSDRNRWLALIVLCLGDLMIVARHDDRERRAAVDPERPRLLADLARVGRERLPAHLRRLPAARRAARRPLRPSPALPGRASPSSPRRRSRAGSRRRRGSSSRARAVQGLGGAVVVRGRALADHDALHRAGGAHEGDGRLRLRRWPAAAAIGVLLGGVLTDTLGWHWIFLVNLPIGVSVFALSLRPAPGGRGQRPPARSTSPAR